VVPGRARKEPADRRVAGIISLTISDPKRTFAKSAFAWHADVRVEFRRAQSLTDEPHNLLWEEADTAKSRETSGAQITTHPARFDLLMALVLMAP